LTIYQEDGPGILAQQVLGDLKAGEKTIEGKSCFRMITNSEDLKTDISYLNAIHSKLKF